jgi:hypothetical protein
VKAKDVIGDKVLRLNLVVKVEWKYPKIITKVQKSYYYKAGSRLL